MSPTTAGAVAASARRVVPAAVFDPKTVAAPLHTWFDAQQQTAANGSAVTALTDQSGNNRTATKNAGTITYNTAGINAHPTFDFVAGAYATTATFTAIPSNMAITVFAAAQFATTGDRALFSAVGFTLQAGAVSANSGAWRMDRGGAQATGGTANTNPHRFRYYFAASSASTSTMTLDGATVIGPTSCGAGAPTTIRIGSNSSGFENFSGKVGEFLLYTGTLTAPEIASMESYLSAKWGL